MATRIVPKTELRDSIRKELAELGEDTLVITERGHPVAITVSVQRWNHLQERLEDLEDCVAILQHRLAHEEGASAEQVFSRIEAVIDDR